MILQLCSKDVDMSEKHSFVHENSSRGLECLNNHYINNQVIPYIVYW